MLTIADKFSFRIAFFATFLALMVVMLGAYTRLKDGGLGCPDWPGCYGQISVPTTSENIAKAAQAFPSQPVEQNKAWAEMIHRYVAGSLGLLILSLFGRSIVRRKKPRQPIVIPSILIGLLIFQALLGKWTVTMRLLPPVVMGHLLGGMLIFVSLGLLTAQLSGMFSSWNKTLKPFRFWISIALIVTFLQIALGGWTSSNYAAIICPDFPTCQGQWLNTLDISGAFTFLHAIGPNYEGGLLPNVARVTIQIFHRLGGALTFLIVGGTSLFLWMRVKQHGVKNFCGLIFLVLILQLSLGIVNVLWLLPLPVAVAHNGVAAILFLLMSLLSYYAWHSESKEVTP